MTYSTILQEAYKELPEFKNRVDLFKANDEIDEDTGVHIVFEYAFTPLLKEELKSNSPLSKRMLVFLEKMASSTDRLTQEVCDQSVLESLADEFEDDEIYPLLHEKTKEGYRAVRQYIGA